MGRRLRRQARYEEVVQLHRSGVPILQIAKRLGMSRQTVRSYIATPAFPERAPHRRRGSILDDYEEYIQQRWAEGCHNALQLWREIRERGYNGGRKPVFSWVQRHRQEPAASTPKKYVRSRREGPSGTTPDEQRRNRHRLASSRQLVWVLLRERQDLDAEEGQLLEQLRGEAEVAQAYGLAQQFLCMVRQRDGAPFDGWLDACLNSPVKELQTFAAGLDQDYGAVSAALRSEWSNGPVEGHVKRLKLLKRQMYGRASFDLLKHRVLNVA